MKNIFENTLYWSISFGIYFSLRFIEQTVRPIWATDTQTITLFWIFTSLFFGLIFTFTDEIVKRQNIRRRAYGFIISFRVFIVFVCLFIVGFFS